MKTWIPCKKGIRSFGSMLDKMQSEIAQGQVTITELKGKLTVNMLDAVLSEIEKVD
jgi:chemotaxis protein MotB